MVEHDTGWKHWRIQGALGANAGYMQICRRYMEKVCTYALEEHPLFDLWKLFSNRFLTAQQIVVYVCLFLGVLGRVDSGVILRPQITV